MAGKKKVRVVFLDRDGVINVFPGRFKYVTCLRKFRMLPGAARGVRRLNGCGFKIAVISNQAGVAKGLYSRRTLDEITVKMKKRLAAEKAKVDAVYYCTHRKEQRCACRKPATGLVTAAVKDFARRGYGVDLKGSFFVGDSIRDLQTAKALGITAILVFSGAEKPGNRMQWTVSPDHTAKNLASAADFICKKEKQ